MFKRCFAAAALATTLAIGATGSANATYVTPRAVAPIAAGGSSAAVWVLGPLFCTAAMPIVLTLAYKRQLLATEAWATALMCTAGPIGLAIAHQRGWLRTFGPTRPR